MYKNLNDVQLLIEHKLVTKEYDDFVFPKYATNKHRLEEARLHAKIKIINNELKKRKL